LNSIFIWPISLAAQALLAIVLTVKGGFPFLRRFCWWGAISGFACLLVILYAGPSWYPPADAVSELGGGILLAFVVGELLIDVDRVERYVLGAALIALPIHLAFARNVPWSGWISVMISGVALLNSVLGITLLMAWPCHRYWWRTPVPVLLSAWMIGTAALFYAAPLYQVGYAVCWLNAFCFVALSFACCF